MALKGWQKSDFIRLAAFAAATAPLLGPESLAALEWLNGRHRYLFGALTFAFMGPLGEDLAARLEGAGPFGLARLAAVALMWGLYGLGAAFFFWFFNGSVGLAQGAGLLPGGGYRLGGGAFLFFITFGSEPFFTGLLAVFCFTRPFLSGRPLWPKAEPLALSLGRALALTFVFMLPPALWLWMSAWCFAVLEAGGGLARRKTVKKNLDFCAAKPNI